MPSTLAIPRPTLLAAPVPAPDPQDSPEERSIGEQLRELREIVGLSQMDVAILCRVDVSTISRWERGRHQHTHRSKDRQIRSALEALTWAAELQEEDPRRVLALDDVEEHVARMRARRLKR
jgi:transcriptional regulator with XRE-family HTH domain